MARYATKPLKAVFADLLHGYRESGGVSATRVRAIYQETMGPYIAKHTTRLYLREHTLHLHIDISALRHELALGKSKLLVILNESLGEAFIREIVFH